MKIKVCAAVFTFSQMMKTHDRNVLTSTFKLYYKSSVIIS